MPCCGEATVCCGGEPASARHVSAAARPRGTADVIHTVGIRWRARGAGNYYIICNIITLIMSCAAVQYTGLDEYGLTVSFSLSCLFQSQFASIFSQIWIYGSHKNWRVSQCLQYWLPHVLVGNNLQINALLELQCNPQMMTGFLPCCRMSLSDSILGNNAINFLPGRANACRVQNCPHSLKMWSGKFALSTLLPMQKRVYRNKRIARLHDGL